MIAITAPWEQNFWPSELWQFMTNVGMLAAMVAAITMLGWIWAHGPGWLIKYGPKWMTTLGNWWNGRRDLDNWWNRHRKLWFGKHNSGDS